jgi:crossover junction endodeoxyribonuclease RuvC
VIAIGIDIGVTGALAAVDSRGTAVVRDLPTVELAGKRLVRRRLDARGLMQAVREIVPPGETALAILEDVHMRPGNGGAATASLLHSRGIVEAVVELARMDVRLVQPPTWKRHFGLLRTDKAASRERAATLYPCVAAQLSRRRDHNRAEAVLLAHYGLTVLS